MVKLTEMRVGHICRIGSIYAASISVKFCICGVLVALCLLDDVLEHALSLIGLANIPFHLEMQLVD